MTDTPWNMARVRSRQVTRKYKPVGPVGEPLCSVTAVGDMFERKMFNAFEATCCEDCGFHCCSCELDPPMLMRCSCGWADTHASDCAELHAQKHAESRAKYPAPFGGYYTPESVARYEALTGKPWDPKEGP